MRPGATGRTPEAQEGPILPAERSLCSGPGVQGARVLMRAQGERNGHHLPLDIAQALVLGQAPLFTESASIRPPPGRPLCPRQPTCGLCLPGGQLRLPHRPSTL